MINKKHLGCILLFVSYTVASPPFNQMARLSFDCTRSCKVDDPCPFPKKCMDINDQCDLCLDPNDMGYDFCLKDTDCLENEHWSNLLGQNTLKLALAVVLIEGYTK